MKKRYIALIILLIFIGLCVAKPYIENLMSQTIKNAQTEIELNTKFVPQEGLYTPDVTRLKSIYDNFEINFANILKEENVYGLAYTSLIKKYPKLGENESIYNHLSTVLDEKFNAQESCYRDYGTCLYPKTSTYFYMNSALNTEDFDNLSYRLYSNDGYSIYFYFFPLGLGDGATPEISKPNKFFKKIMDTYGDESAKREMQEDVYFNETKLQEIYAFVYIDINGRQAPNIWGADLFAYNLGQDGKLYPFYGFDRAVYSKSNWMAQESKYRCANEMNDNNTGESCADRIYRNNWQINYQVDISGDLDREISNCLNEKICITFDMPEYTLYSLTYDTEFDGDYVDARHACSEKSMFLPSLEEAQLIAQSSKPLDKSKTYWTSTEFDNNRHFVIPSQNNKDIESQLDGNKNLSARCVFRKFK